VKIFRKLDSDETWDKATGLSLGTAKHFLIIIGWYDSQWIRSHEEGYSWRERGLVILNFCVGTESRKPLS